MKYTEQKALMRIVIDNENQMTKDREESDKIEASLEDKKTRKDKYPWLQNVRWQTLCMRMYVLREVNSKIEKILEGEAK